MTTLRLTVTETPQGSTLRGQHFDITEAGASLGRGAANNCVLQDNERIVSSRHASVSYQLGQFVITDHSTNGTFINNSPMPLGPDNSTALAEGDTITMGQYRFQVSVVQQAAAAPAASAGSFLDELSTPSPAASAPAIPAAPAAMPPAGNGGAAGPLDDFDRWLEPQTPSANQAPLWGTSNVIHSDIPAVDEESDPLAAIDQARQSDSPFSTGALDDDDPDWWKGSQKDNAPAINQAFSTPQPIAVEPTPVPPPEPPPAFAAQAPAPTVDDASDLDALLGLDSGTPADMAAEDLTIGDVSLPSTPVPEPEPIQAAPSEEPEPPAFVAEPTPVPPPTPEPVAAPTPPPAAATPAPAPVTAGGDAHQQTAALLAQLLELGQLEPQQLEGLTDNVVGVLRETVTRLLEMLRARSSIKNELRLERTMIQPVENNPLKFAVTEKDALRYLFGERSGAYMAPSKAVIEAFEDIESHQLALLAGMRQAYEHMLSKFSPDALEHRFAEVAHKGLLVNKKSRLWDAYQEYFDKLQQDPETSFNRLFGNEFAEAYEEQINNIKAGKRDRAKGR